MKRVYKYTLNTQDEQVLDLPMNAQLLTVGTQNGIPQLWALVDIEEERTEERKIIIRGTGHDIDEDAVKEYIATFTMSQGRLVFHVFEIY